jgi:tetratricopeptide (TPR) repeat protein
MTIDSTWLARVNGPVAEAPWATGAVHGRLLLHRRQLREGLEILQDSARTLRGLGMQSALPQTLAWLAEGFQMTGQFERARTTAEEGLDVIRRTGVRSSDPELYRLRGEAMLATRSAGDQHAGDRDGAEASFWAGITVARQQAARTLELRASVSLADLLLNSGRKDEARQILAPVCEAFAINVTSPDLVRARKVLRACM